MQKDNSAVYECPGDRKKGLHTWRRDDDLTTSCTKCKLKLTKEQADDVWRE